MKIRYIISVVLFSFLFSCSTKDEKSIEQLLTSYGKAITKTKYVIMIIPLDGCGSCITSSISFAKENCQMDNLYIVASTLEKKKMNLSFNISTFKGTNFIEDLQCLAERFDLVTTTPSVFFLDKGKIKGKVLVTYENSEATFMSIIKW